jgi:hypothetical protein
LPRWNSRQNLSGSHANKQLFLPGRRTKILGWLARLIM